MAERLLHVAKRVAQHAYLVIVPDVGQWGVEIAFRHFFCRTGEAVQGGCYFSDLLAAEQIDSRQTDEHGQQDGGVEHAPVPLDQVFGYHHHDGPLHVFDSTIENPRRHTVDNGRYGPLLTLESHVCIECVSQHAVLVRMENVTAVAVDDAVV